MDTPEPGFDPIPDPLDDYLLPLAEAPARWCAFDPAWYLAAHQVAREALGEAPSDEAVRAYYLAHGQSAGHTPVIWFDEAWYRASNPAIADAIAEGHWRSGFEQYCLEGSADRSPHWLYDDAVYRALNPDLTDEALGASGCFNRYDHYLRDGAFTGRPAHLLFDAATYAAAHADDPTLAEQGAYAHYLHALWAGAPETRTSPYFDPVWYRGYYPRCAAPPYRGALHHYLANPTPTEFDPLVDFMEAHYLATYPDVAAQVKAGALRNGYDHFLRNGANERRTPAPWIDLRTYLGANPDADAAIASHAVPHAFAHLLQTGLPAGRGITAAAPARDQAMLPLRARGRLDFTCPTTPLLTAIVTLPPQRARAVAALATLRAEIEGPVELILLDPASHGPGLAAMMPGARVLPLTDLAAARNAAIAEAAAPILLFLDAGCEPAAGAIRAAFARLARDPSAGAVGGPSIGPDGLLMQAGLIVFADASVAPYLPGASPQTAEAGFVRDADACASSLLLVRATLPRALGGFLPDLPPAAADADLCLGIWQSGYRVVCDPVVALLYDDPRAARVAKGLALAAAGTDALATRHRDYLAHRPAPRAARPDARTPRTPIARVLLVEETIPDATAPTTAHIASLVAGGADVTLYPLDGGPADPALLPGFLPDTVEIVCGPGREGLDAFLAARAGMFSKVEGQ